MSGQPVAHGVVVEVAGDDAELASDALWALGATAVEERPVGAGVELRTALGDDRHVVATRMAGFAWPWRFEVLDPAGADGWRAHARPTVVDEGLVVYPAWLPRPPGPVAVAVEPGPTFGLGNHPSTVLALRALRRVLRPGDQLLDVGTGSGVLAVAAVVLGAARAHGIDVQPGSPAVALANAERNGVGDRVTAGLELLAEVAGVYDVVVANILAPVLIDLAADLSRVTRRCLVLSGLLAGRTEHVEAALAPWRRVAEVVDDGWTALILER